MSNTDSHQHVVKTSAQWNERAIEYWIVPRGCLCVELTPKGKTKLKVGEGNKNYYQLPYIYDFDVLLNYYTKEQVDALFNNYNRMAIMSTNEYNSATDLPRYGNKFGDVRFVKSKSPSIKTDPDLYVWNGHKWIFIGTPFNEITDYVNREEFNQLKARVEVVEQKAHTHDNKEILDSITQADREKFDSLHNYDDTEIRELIAETGHTHPNKPVLDQITQADLDKLDSLHNYDDTELRRKISNQKTQIDELEAVKHSHDNKSTLDRITDEMLDELDTFAQCCFEVKQDIAELKENEHSHHNLDLLNATTASYTLEDQKILYDLYHIGAFLGAGPTWDGTMGYVPMPEAGCQNYFLRGDGTWALVKATGDKYKAGEGIYILSGEVTADSFPFKLYAKGGYVKQYIIYGAPGGVGDYNSTTGKYHIPIRVSAEGHTPIETVIQIEQQLLENDWINFELQEYSVYRTILRNDLEAIRVSNYSSITTTGSISNVPGSWGEQFGLTNYYEIDPDAIYEMPPEGRAVYNYANVNMYDANKNRTRTILRSQTASVQIIPQPGEKYLRIASAIDIFNNNTFARPVLTRLADTVFPVTIPLQQIQLIPNTINTIDVLTTVKPLDMYVETVVPPDPDPDDPMSEYTGIIYNDGVLDVTQEDPTNLAELTIHFRDNVDKTLTIPGGTVMEGATASTDGEVGLVPAPLAGDQIKFLRGDGTWVKVKSDGDKYKAGEGITILSGEVISDTFPFEIFPKADRVTQYVIYGTHNGVGNYVLGHYEVPIKVSAPGYSDRVQTISIADPLYDGDYIDYQRQIFSHYRTDVTAGYTTDSNNYGYEWAIYSDGHIGKLSPGAFGGSPTVTVAVPLEPGAKYELTPWNGDGRFMAGMYLNLYDANMNLTRTIFQEYEGNTVIIPNAGEVYMRLTIQSTSSLLASDRHMYRLLSVETPCSLQELTLYPNVINTVDVLTTNKPNEIYVEVEPAEDEPVDPDDPMSEYTGIIYNDGILDVTQEDPNALNELTFHYRDNVTKTLTIPAGGGGDETYEAGNGIEFTRSSTLPSGYTQLSYVASGDTTSYIDTGVSHGFTAHIDLQYEESNHRQLMGVGLSSGMYFGSNASEEFEMYYAIAGTDTTQRNSIIWYHDEINPARLEVAGESITDTDPGTSSNTFKIFSPFASDGYGSSVKIYSVDIYDNNNTLIRKFIPCQSPSNVVGMYDSVNDVFYSPTGTPLSAGLPLGNVVINAKLGDGLSFDSNDAITVDEMTGATSLVDGTSGTVPAPLAGDEEKFLRGDGTWVEVEGGGGAIYSAGDGIEITDDRAHVVFDREHVRDLSYFFDTQVQCKISHMWGSTRIYTKLTDEKALGAIVTRYFSGYSNPLSGPLFVSTIETAVGYGTNYDSRTFLAEPTTFEYLGLTWYYTNLTDGNNGYYEEYNGVSPDILGNMTALGTIYPAGSSIVDIAKDIIDLANLASAGHVINAKISGGLQFDANDAIEVKLGDGLQFDANGAIETTGSGSGGQYEAGTGINIISDSGSTVSRTLKVNAQTAQANDYTIYGASGGVGEPSINLMPQLTTSSIWANTWYADGTHEGQPVFSKNTWYGGITNEVYLTEGTYTFSLDVKLSSTSVQGLLANELNDQSRYPHYNQAATVDIMHYGPFYPVDTDWHRYSYTFEVTTAGYVACRAENVSSSSATISVARPQLERGSIAHDYVEHEHYVIPIIVSAPNETDIEVFIETSAPLDNGDSLNFIDDSLPTLTLYQNKINTITVNTTVVPSRFTVDASAGSDVTSVIELDDSITIRFNCNNDPNEY